MVPQLLFQALLLNCAFHAGHPLQVKEVKNVLCHWELKIEFNQL
jgi:hypothetical protein